MQFERSLVDTTWASFVNSSAVSLPRKVKVACPYHGEGQLFLIFHVPYFEAFSFTVHVLEEVIICCRKYFCKKKYFEVNCCNFPQVWCEIQIWKCVWIDNVFSTLCYSHCWWMDWLEFLLSILWARTSNEITKRHCGIPALLQLMWGHRHAWWVRGKKLYEGGLDTPNENGTVTTPESRDLSLVLKNIDCKDGELDGTVTTVV